MTMGMAAAVAEAFFRHTEVRGAQAMDLKYAFFTFVLFIKSLTYEMSVEDKPIFTSSSDSPRNAQCPTSSR